MPGQGPPKFNSLDQRHNQDQLSCTRLGRPRFAHPCKPMAVICCPPQAAALLLLLIWFSLLLIWHSLGNWERGRPEGVYTGQRRRKVANKWESRDMDGGGVGSHLAPASLFISFSKSHNFYAFPPPSSSSTICDQTFKLSNDEVARSELPVRSELSPPPFPAAQPLCGPASR